MIFFRNIKNYHPANFFAFIFIGIILWMKVFIAKDAQGIYHLPDPTPVYGWLYGGLAGFTLFNKIIAFCLVLLHAIILNAVANQYNLLGFRGYLPGFFFIMITSNIPEYQTLHPFLIANLLFLVSWIKIASIQEKSNAYIASFNAAFFIGLATLFYPNIVYFVLIVIIGTSLNRVSRPREFFMIIFGFLTVWYFYISLNYIFLNQLKLDGIALSIGVDNQPFKTLSLGQTIFFSYLVLLIVLASFQVSIFVSNLKIQIRRNLKIFFIWFLLGLLLFLFTPSSFEMIYSNAIPVSLLIALFIANIKRKWLAEIIWILFLGMTIVNQYFPSLLD